MPNKKGKNKAAAQSPAAGTGAMYDTIPGPGYRIQAPLTVLKEHRKHITYSSAGLCETVGRVGHVAFLSPDQQTICVVGGDAVRRDEDEVGSGWSAPGSSSDDEDLDTPSSSVHGLVAGGFQPEDAPPTINTGLDTLPPPSHAKNTGRADSNSKLSTPAPLSSTPAPPPGSPSPNLVPSTAAPTTTTTTAGQVPQQNLSTSVVRRAAPGVIPAEFRTDFPLLECFRIRSGTWFIPNGERKRSSACKGLIRWPTQSGALVAWGSSAGNPGNPGATWDTDSLTGPLHTGKPPLPTGPGSQTATPVRPTAPGPAPTGSGRTGSRNTSPAATPDRRGGPGSPSTAAAPAAVPATTTPTPTPVATPPMGQLREDSPARGVGLPDISLLTTRQRSKWDGPSSVFVLGGWDGVRRLSTLLDYNVSNPSRQQEGQLQPSCSQHRRLGGTSTTALDDAAELVLTSIPQVVDLPVLPPITHATATLVKDRWYVFGGNTVSGALDDLYVVESSRLREAVLESQRVGDFLGGVSLGDNGLWGGAGGNAMSARRGSRQRTSQVAHAAQVQLPSGWDCKPISGSAYVAMGVNTANSSSSPLRDSDVYGDHEVSAVFSANSRATPSNFGGTASMMIGASNPVTAAPMVPIKNTLPGPAPRSSHAAVALHGRYLIIFGGRQLVLPHAEPAGRSRSKSVQRKAPVAKKGGKEGKEGHKGGKGNKAPPPPVDEDEEMLPTLKLLDDLAVFDTEIRGWVQVRVIGSDHPPARYSAAMCVVPPPPSANAVPPTSSHAFESLQEVSVASLNFQPHRRDGSSNGSASLGPKEVVLHGGFGEKDVILSDMWILQAIGKGQGGSLVEVDATSGVPTMRVRWIRVQREAPHPDSLANSTTRTGSVPLGGGAHPSSSSNNNANAAGISATPAPASPGGTVTPTSVPAPGAVGMENPISGAVAPVELPSPEFPARAQHAIVATAERDVYVVGGVQPFVRFGNLHHFPNHHTFHHNAGQSSGDAKLHPCVTTDRTEVVKITLPTLDAVTEVALHRKGSLYKAKK